MKAAAPATSSASGGTIAAPAPTVRSYAAPVWNRSPWKWFFSIGVGVFLLLILTIASIIGTTIDPLQKAQALVFYTWWYQALLLALAVNMGCATYKTIIQKLVPTHQLRLHHEKSFYTTAQLGAEIPFTGTVAEATAAFGKAGFAVRHDDEAGAARTGWWGRLGAPISHLGIIVVLLAGFASAFVAKEGVVQVAEGRSATTMQMRGSDEIAPLGFTLNIDDFSTGFFPRTRIPSHYTSVVTARDGAKVLYAGAVEVNTSPNIMGWSIHQTSYQELPTLPRYKVEVAGASLAEPVALEVSPGQSIAVNDALQLLVDDKMNWTLTDGAEKIAGGALMPSAMEGANLTIIANRFEPDFVLGEDRKITSRTEELNNPALHVTLKNNGEPVATQWLFGRADMRAFSHNTAGHFKMELGDIQKTEEGHAFVVSVSDSNAGMLIGRTVLILNAEQPITAAAAAEGGDACCADHAAPAATAATTGSGDYTVALGEKVPAYATVLSLSRNPAIPTIYVGCVLMILGLFVSFFVPRRDVWFLHDAEKGVLRVVAHYRHLSDQFDRTTRAAIARISTPHGKES